MRRRAHSVKVLLALVLSSGVLIATSEIGVELRDDLAVDLAPGETATGTILLSRRAARRTDRSWVEVTVAASAPIDAALDATPADAGGPIGSGVVVTMNSLPTRVDGGFLFGYDDWAASCRDDCSVPVTLTNEGATTVQVEFLAVVEDTGSGGFFCGKGANYPDDATLEIVVP